MSEYKRGKFSDVSVASTDHINSDLGSHKSRGQASPATISQPDDSSRSPIAEIVASRNNDLHCSPDQEYSDRPDQSASQNLQCNDTIHTNMGSEALLPDGQLQPFTRDIGRSSRNSPEPAHTDQEGHYVGPASGVSFLARALKRLRQAGPSASKAHQPCMFNFADSPVPHYDPYFLILPSQTAAQSLVRRYFDFASPTHRYLHQPTVEKWCDEFYHSVKNPGPLAPGGHEKRAIILGVLAVANQYSSNQDLGSPDVVNRYVDDHHSGQIHANRYSVPYSSQHQNTTSS